MNIRDLKISTGRGEHLRNKGVGGANRAEAAYAGQKAAGTAGVKGDTVEISEAARIAAGDSQATEINFARKALLGIPPLNQERAADILRRIQEGYYSQPEIMRQTITALVTDLTGRN